MFSIKFWLLWFFWWNCICVLIFLRTFLSSLHFCEVSSVYYSFNPFSVQFYCFPPMDFFSCHCPCSVFISSKAKHESLLSEFFQIWWNKLTCFCLEVLYCVFPFLAYLSQILLVWPCVYRQRLSMQKLVKNLIAFNELISAAFQTAFGFVNLQNVQGMSLTIASPWQKLQLTYLMQNFSSGFWIWGRLGVCSFFMNVSHMSVKVKFNSERTFRCYFIYWAERQAFAALVVSSVSIT